MKTPRRYLIVDDNRALAENLAEILRDMGAEVEVAGNGAQALERIQRSEYSALVTDMRMPGMAGAALVQEVRRADPGLPVVAITAYTRDADLRSAWRQGLLAVLPKPVPIQELLQCLRLARRAGLVALVEDDPALSDNLAEALRARGFTAVTATSILEAEQLGPWRPFAAIVDLRMEGAPDGHAMRRLAERFPRLPMLVITAYADRSPPVDHQGLFTKPFSTPQLLERLEALHQGEGTQP